MEPFERAVERVYQEVSQQLRRVVPCEGVAIALAVADEVGVARAKDGAELRLAYRDAGGGDSAALERALQPSWRAAIDGARVITRPRERRRAHDDAKPGGGLELTAPMLGAEGVIGALTVLAEPIESPQRLEEAQRVVATLAAQTAAAVDRARLVARVEHKQRLETIGEFATGVAHELRNPLFGISSAAQLLRFRAREDPVLEKSVGRILREVERLNRMVTSLLEFGRARPVRLAPGDPDAVWDEVLEAHRGRLEERALQVRRTKAHPPARCPIDAELLAQVFLNVLVNAIDAAPEASDLTLTSLTLPTGAWRCQLHDAGPAVPPEVLARAFEIFFSTKPGGTGIGLALCQRIVDEHHGTITLESLSGAGTTATIVLPSA